jgi:hypothetical protein
MLCRAYDHAVPVEALMLLTIFGDLERVLADLYPYRMAITAVSALALAGLAFWLVRNGLLSFIWRHRVASMVIGAPLLVVAVIAGNYLLSPLWDRSYLNEESPLAMTSPAVAPQTSSQPAAAAPQTGAASVFQARPTHMGMFKGADDFHFGRGDASLIATAPNTNVLRFENFSVRNGPDLYVYLSRETGVRRVDEALNLGRLKATDGAFNYELPAGVDLAGVKSVVVWCKQFGVLFAEAPLTPRA